MQSLDYFWLQDGKQIYTARCQLETGEVVGRISYVLCDTGKILFGGHRYEKASLERPNDFPDLPTVCDLPGDTCLAIPETAVVGALDPRKEFPRVREHISDQVANFLDTFLKETNLPEKDVVVIGSQLFGGGEKDDISDVDVSIYGEKHIEVLRDFIQSLLHRGLVKKLPLDRDHNDRSRMEFFGISPSGMKRIRATQWFRKFLWSGLLVTLCFAPRDSYKISLTLLGPEVEATGSIVQNHSAYSPPFFYQLYPDPGYDVEWCASFAWCFRHAFAVGERIAARGSIAQVDGRRCLWVWKTGHYLRPI